MAEKENQTLARIKKRKDADSKGDRKKKESIPFSRQVRGWTDALFLAFLFAMFIRLFIFELFQIPTGSMTPALIGDQALLISEYDWDGDGQEDIVLNPPPNVGRYFLQIHLKNEDGNFDRMLTLTEVPLETMRRFINPENKGKGRKDMIMVNKFSYWFSEPNRGDIAVFKVPDRPDEDQPFDVSKPVYIKRVAATPDEDLVIQSTTPYEVRDVGHPDRVTPDSFGGREIEIESNPLIVDGEEVDNELYDRLHHFPRDNFFASNGVPNPNTPDMNLPANGKYEGFVMLGDNQSGSSDSRYWGRVPEENVRGKAILRYNPFHVFGLLEHAE